MDNASRRLRPVGWGRVRLPWTKRRLEEAEEFGQQLLLEAIAKDQAQAGQRESAWRAAEPQQRAENAPPDEPEPKTGPIPQVVPGRPFLTSRLTEAEELEVEHWLRSELELWKERASIIAARPSISQTDSAASGLRRIAMLAFSQLGDERMAHLRREILHTVRSMPISIETDEAAMLRWRVLAEMRMAFVARFGDDAPEVEDVDDMIRELVVDLANRLPEREFPQIIHEIAARLHVPDPFLPPSLLHGEFRTREHGPKSDGSER